MSKMVIVVSLFLVACSIEEEDPVLLPDAQVNQVCSNVFDERCMATNGCGVTGHFCCYQFNPGTDSWHNTCSKGNTCVQDICTLNQP